MRQIEQAIAPEDGERAMASYQAKVATVRKPERSVSNCGVTVAKRRRVVSA